MIGLRRRTPALSLGSYRPIAASGDLLLYVREDGRNRVLIALNLGGEPTAVMFPSGALLGRMLLSSFCDRDDETIRGRIDLRGHEGAVVELAKETVLP